MEKEENSTDTKNKETLEDQKSNLDQNSNIDELQIVLKKKLKS